MTTNQPPFGDHLWTDWGRQSLPWTFSRAPTRESSATSSSCAPQSCTTRPKRTAHGSWWIITRVASWGPYRRKWLFSEVRVASGPPIHLCWYLQIRGLLTSSQSKYHFFINHQNILPLTPSYCSWKKNNLSVWMKEICSLLVKLHIIFFRMQRVHQHVRLPIIQVACPTCCYQVCALGHANVGTADLDYSLVPCHRNVPRSMSSTRAKVCTTAFGLCIRSSRASQSCTSLTTAVQARLWPVRRTCCLSWLLVAATPAPLSGCSPRSIMWSLRTSRSRPTG